MTSPLIYRIAFVADEITGFIRNHDSTWSMMQAAHGLGHAVYYTKSLEAAGSASFLKLSDEFFRSQNHPSSLCSDATKESKLLILDQASIDSQVTMNLEDFDYIFMRKDPPVDDEYKRECKIMAQCKKAKVINKPESLINLNEKLMILNFPDLIIETIVTDDLEVIKAFVNNHGKVVMKPLDGFGGAGISLLELDSVIECPSEQMMLQKYIPDIKLEGDKRIIVVNGKPIGALLRIPPENDFRANLAVGGSYAKYQMNERDREICDKIKPFLLENGIYFAGVDLIGNYLTEINITSPTCLQEINRVEGLEGRDRLEYRLILSLF
ncbi:MAG: glutathione synthase [Cyanobacteria bacterium]|nr:glutathione synthase [Cyanobacteriota bacterium]